MLQSQHVADHIWPTVGRNVAESTSLSLNRWMGSKRCIVLGEKEVVYRRSRAYNNILTRTSTPLLWQVPRLM